LTDLINIIVNGLMVGSVYSLMAVGIVVINKASGVFNFAQGHFMLTGAYVFGSLLAQFQLPIWGCFLVTFAAMAVLGLSCERLTMRPLIGQPILSLILMTMALAQLISGLVTFIWKGHWIIYPKLMESEIIKLGKTEISTHLFFGFLLAVLSLLIFSLYFKYTTRGLAMRGTSEDHQLAQSMGISVKNVFSEVWVVSAIVGSLAGIILASLMGAQTMVVHLGFKAFAVVLLGGLESVAGAIIAGPLIGIIENVASGYLDPVLHAELKEVMPFVIVLIVLFFKPYGLFGLKRIERV